MRRYLTMISVSVVCFMVYPMAPPWMAARDGYLTDDIARITGRGWFDLTASASSSNTAQQNVSAIGNQVAAMPSLHSALAIFIAWWVVTRFTHPWRWVVWLYPTSMLFSLVYYAEHYVVDEIAGALLVVVVMLGWAWWERRRPLEAAAVSSELGDDPVDAPRERLDVGGVNGGVHRDPQLVATELAVGLGVDDAVGPQHLGDLGGVDRVVEVDGADDQ